MEITLAHSSANPALKLYERPRRTQQIWCIIKLPLWQVNCWCSSNRRRWFIRPRVHYYLCFAYKRKLNWKSRRRIFHADSVVIISFPRSHAPCICRPNWIHSQKSSGDLAQVRADNWNSSFFVEIHPATTNQEAVPTRSEAPRGDQVIYLPARLFFCTSCASADGSTSVCNSPALICDIYSRGVGCFIFLRQPPMLYACGGGPKMKCLVHH